MADSNQENTLESAQRDISNAVKMGANAAKTAKTVGKVAAQAASGNVAGAAVTLLKDPQTLKKILIIALLPVSSLCVLGFSFCTPCQPQFSRQLPLTSRALVKNGKKAYTVRKAELSLQESLRQ